MISLPPGRAASRRARGRELRGGEGRRVLALRVGAEGRVGQVEHVPAPPLALASDDRVQALADRILGVLGARQDDVELLRPRRRAEEAGVHAGALDDARDRGHEQLVQAAGRDVADDRQHPVAAVQVLGDVEG
jgi:hypothetical protein